MENAHAFLTESDVEQKFVLKLLIEQEPTGLGYSLFDFRTKLDLRKIKIDKGNKASLYYPDYLIILNGLPLVIIEVKHPNEDIKEGLKEARLYASEINKEFPSEINPCSKIVSTNGLKTIASKWDSEQDCIEFKYEDANISNPDFYKFIHFLKKNTIKDELSQLQKKVRKQTKFIKPTLLLGGKSFQNATIGENSFGSNISIEYKYLFNPQTKEERSLIAKNAYVSTKRKLSHVNPIDRLIRATISPSFSEAKKISSTENPTEIIEALNDFKKIKHQVLLLIGSVGSGKSTFIDFLKETALPSELREATYWLSLDMNNAPSSRDLVYEWVLEMMLETVISDCVEYDLREISVLRKLFAKEIKDFEKGPAALLQPNTESYNKELYEFIQSLIKDKSKYFKAIINFLYAFRSKSVIIILDNVDKRDREVQLLMFELANWLKSSFSCTVFLPIREITFDYYRKEPPLDTVIKDFVFRIEPPLLEQVIYKRFNYALREIDSDNTRFYYYLSNGAKVECKRQEIKNYLSCILKALFQNPFFKRLITGLSERDIRRGLELFLDFCKSGHISEDDILRMRLNPDEYELPNHIVTRILLRGDRRFYSDGASPLKNLFHSYPEATIPDPFVRLSILNWLKYKFREIGPNNIKGYFPVVDLIKDLAAYGHDEVRIFEELNALSKAKCIINEEQSNEVCYENLVCITSAGFVHLDLLSNIDYLSTVSEDTWFKNLSLAEKIKENICQRDLSSALSKSNVIENSKVLADYLIEYKRFFPCQPVSFLEDNVIRDYSDISHIQTFVNDIVKKDCDYSKIQSLISAYPKGTMIDSQIVDIKDYGVFVEFGLDAQGFVHVSDVSIGPDEKLDDLFEIGEIVKSEVLKFSKEHNRFKLKIIS